MIRPSNDVTYENSQARERTQLLMDVAKPEERPRDRNRRPLRTGTRLATYNGDHMSMYGVNGSIPKTLVKYLVEWVANHKVTMLPPHLAGYRRHADQPRTDPGRRERQHQAKDRGLGRPVRTARLLPLHFLRFGSHPSKIYFLAQKPSQASTTMQRSRNGSTPSSAASSNNNSNASCLPDGPKGRLRHASSPPW